MDSQLELSILNGMSYAMAFTGVVVFYMLTFTSFKASYGRYGVNSFFPKVNARLAWFIQEFPSFFIPLWLIAKGECRQVGNYANLLVLLMFVGHYFQRTFVYSCLIRGGKPTPMHSFLLAVMFCSFNGLLQGRYHCQYASYYQEFSRSWQFLIGVTLFIYGLVVNIHSDYVLRNLRKPGEVGYKIPKGGMFNYITGANFFGEIVEWLGYAIAAGTPAAWAFAVFTAFNIGPRAYHHHKFYLDKFDDYPKERKAIIPFLL